MTMLNLDGVLVIYEGTKHRLRWEHQPGWIPALELMERPRPERRVLGHIWPTRSIQTTIRREIGHGQKSVVVLDGQSPIVELPRTSVPRIPPGATELTGADADRALLCVTPLAWLGAKDRARGEAFASGAESLFNEQHLPSSPHVEADLVGTSEPLRFVYYRRPLGIDTLRDVIARVFPPRQSAHVLPIGLGHAARSLPGRAPARKVA